MPRNRKALTMHDLLTLGEYYREPTLLEAAVKSGIRDLKALPAEEWQAELICLEETSDFQESLVLNLVLAWIPNKKLPPKTERWLRIRFLARLVHALRLHRQLALKPPPGFLPWPLEDELSPSQWLWLLADSWLLANVDFVIGYLWSHE